MSQAFHPPNEKQRRTAIGPTSSLAPQLRRALDPGDDFEPIPAPRASDWLANHEEPGQTFLQFAASRRNVPDRTRNKIYLLPLGAFEEGSPSLDKLRAFAEAFFGLPAEVLPTAEIDRTFTTRVHPETRRRQLLTRDVLAWLRGKLPRDGFLILGVTMTDLYPADDWNYVFGQASLRDRVGVYSFARYDPRFFGEEAGDDVQSLMLLRSCKVLGHESCHMFSMPHCIYFTCLLNGSNHLEEADARPLHLCPVCLRKLQHSVGFDVERRYERLRDFSREAGFKEQQQWLENRLRQLR
ncbi:MAG: archaemetzincin [Pirellulaceae bacterium]